VAVLIADTPVRAVDDELGSLVLGNAATYVGGFLLRLMNRRHPLVARAADGPSIPVGHNVLVLSSHVGLLFERVVILKERPGNVNY
jgi:hypothetical protein